MSVEHTFTSREGLETRVITKAKAIRFKCLDCCAQQPGEVQKCTVVHCPLYPFRFGNEKGLEKFNDPDADSEVSKEKEDEEWASLFEEEEES